MAATSLLMPWSQETFQMRAAHFCLFLTSTHASSSAAARHDRVWCSLRVVAWIRSDLSAFSD